MHRWSSWSLALLLMASCAVGAFALDAEGAKADAPATTGQPGPRQPPSAMDGMFLPLMMLGLFGLFYFLVLRPANRRMAQERDNMLNSLEKNDVVLTIGGIYATVVSVSKEADEILVKLEDNAKMKITRGAISQNVTKDKEKREAQQQTTAATEAKK